MDIFDVLTMIGGLCLFLFGMDVMGGALERRAGGSLKKVLATLTRNKLTGFLTGLGVTSVIQSSSATTVMVVGFVNSGIMTLRQSIGVIMGANIGTTVTAWVLSLGGISSDNIFMQLLKPTSFTPVLALIGTAMLMFGKSSKKKDTGMILLGFATLMFGMDTMSDAVSGLADVPAFQNMFLMFRNPILGVIVGALLTATIQSSSASVGILQALSVTGQVSYGAAVPIIMGQNIGTCITALLSSLGTNKNAKRAAVIHLAFNVLGTIICLILFSLISALLKPALLDESATYLGIAVTHSVFNLACTAILLPMSALLEKIAIKLIPDTDDEEKEVKLDERLLATPSIALEVSHNLTMEMAQTAVKSVKETIAAYDDYSDERAEKVRRYEGRSDKYEDTLGSYLVKLSEHQVTTDESLEIAKLLKVIGDFERITDHSVNVLESFEEMNEKKIKFSDTASSELKTMFNAVNEILDMTLDSFIGNNTEAMSNVEPLEKVIDKLKDKLRNQHIVRLQQGECTIEAGFIWADLITNLERISDHCSNITSCMIESAADNMNFHEVLREERRDNPEFTQKYDDYRIKYSV